MTQDELKELVDFFIESIKTFDLESEVTEDDDLYLIDLKYKTINGCRTDFLGFKKRAIKKMKHLDAKVVDRIAVAIAKSAHDYIKDLYFTDFDKVL